MKIAVDAMGGDYAPAEIVKGALDAASEFGNDQIVLVGDRKKIKKYFDRSFNNVEIVHTDEFIGMDESPSVALKAKKNSSMKLAAEQVKSGDCQAMVCAGNTGALLESSLLTLGRIGGIKRPALAVLLPSKKKPVMLLDAGANADCRIEYLMQFAYMGSIYMERVAGVKRPRVGLLNIGEEEGKGDKFYRETYDKLKETKGINFIGNVEPRKVFAGDVEVAVADGFVGNMALKSSEAATDLLNSLLREGIKKSMIAKVAALTLKPIFKSMKKCLDPSEHGGALLLGLKGIVVKSHGRADARTIFNAVALARRIHEQKVLTHIQEIVSKSK